jgi:probable F420-dependent oxidoreductase
VIVSTGLMPRGRQGHPECLAALAESAEAAGLARIWIGDHVVYPVEYQHRYPAGDGVLPYNPASPQLDILASMSWLLAGTRRVGVGSLVMVIGLRQPVALAKQLATLDVLSGGGRVTLGIGAGWMAEEFEVLGISPRRRGARTDEYLDALAVLWTAEQPCFHGEFVNFAPLYCNPKPVRGTIPVWVGGVTDAALDRVVRAGSGWLPSNVTPEIISRTIPELRQRAAAAGRDPDGIGVACAVTATDADEIRRTVAAYRAAGVTEVIIPVQGKSPGRIAEFVASIPSLAS